MLIRSVFTTAIKRTFLPGVVMDILINLTGLLVPPCAPVGAAARFLELIPPSQTAALSRPLNILAKVWRRINDKIDGEWLICTAAATGTRLAHSLCEAHALLSPTQPRQGKGMLLNNDPRKSPLISMFVQTPLMWPLRHTLWQKTARVCFFSLPFSLQHCCCERDSPICNQRAVTRRESVIQLQHPPQGCLCLV